MPAFRILAKEFIMLTKRNTWPRFLILLLLASAAQSARAVPTVPIAVDANPQYFFYDNQTIALVGMSAEFLCHVRQPNQDPAYCTYDNYPAYIDGLVAKHLNKFQLWVGLNHSPGKQLSGTGNPYEEEQPFRFLTSAKWDLNQYAERPTPTAPKEFFDRLEEVVAYAADPTRNVIVEIVLFDPWSGDHQRGPWWSTQNVNNIGFSLEKYFASFDNGSADAPGGVNAIARAKQVALMKKVVQKLNPYKNVYWQIANEPEINANNGVTGDQAKTWHRSMIQQLYCYEDTLPGGHHLIAVNYHTATALGDVPNAFTPCASGAVPKIDIVNGHYVELDDTSRYAAIPMIRSYHRGPQGSLDRIFGFNEGRYSGEYTLNPPGITGEAARAEAWEFMLNEGGVYDRYSINKASARSLAARQYLQYLADFLKTFTLRNLVRENNSPPAWAQGLLPYPNLPLDTACRTSACTFWGAMHWTRNEYALYVHHSQVLNGPNDPKFRAYQPVITSPPSYQEQLQLRLGSLTATFLAEWIDPGTGTTIGTPVCINWPGSGSYALDSPVYAFDIALRIKRQPC
jgi:hypothetical protein